MNLPHLHTPLTLKITGSLERNSRFRNSRIFLRFWAPVAFAAVLGLGQARAAFLDFSLPPREAALGGNGVAVPEGTSDLVFNPAGLGEESRFRVSARYENLFSGIDGDNLSTGNLSAVFPLDAGDALGLSVDQFGGFNLQQDRISAAFGKSFEARSFLSPVRLGVSFSYLMQQFTLSPFSTGIDPSHVSAGAFSVGGGLLLDPFPWLTLGVSGEDINEPNLGVVGVDLVPLLLRYGVAVKPNVGDDHLLLTLAQSWSENLFAFQAGAEWTFTKLGISLRAGGDASSGVAGLGWRTGGLTIDYAYQFSWMDAPSLGGVGLPGSHLLEVGFSWENSSREGRVYAGLLFRGQEALKDKKWKESYWYFQQAYLLRPNEPAVLEGREQSLRQYNKLRAESYYQEGRKAENEGYFREAQRDYEWAGSLDPQEKSYSESRDNIKKALTEGALGDPRIQKLLEKSVEWLKKGKRENAIKEIQESRILYPKDAFLDFMSRAFASRSDAHSGGKDIYLERLEVEAEIYRSKGRMDLAKETWQKMLKSDPGNAMAKENLEEAAGDSANKLSPQELKRSRALLQRGLKAYANGDVETAVHLWEDVLKIDPQNVNALNNLTRVKMEEGRDLK